jgi:hypothetical protein
MDLVALEMRDCLPIWPRLSALGTTTDSRTLIPLFYIELKPMGLESIWDDYDITIL